MRKIPFIAPLSLALLTLFACEKEVVDDNNNNNNGGGDTTVVDTQAPSVNSFTINNETSRVYVPVGTSLTVHVEASDNVGVSKIGTFGYEVFEDFGGEAPIDNWLSNAHAAYANPAKSKAEDFTITSSADFAAGPYNFFAAAEDAELLSSGVGPIEVILTKDKQPLISLPDNGTNTTVTTSLSARPPKFNVKARFDDGEGLTFRNLKIYPKSVDAGKTPYEFEKYDEATGNSVNVTVLEIVPDTIATGTYEYVFSAGDTEGNVTLFFGDFVVTP